MVVIFHSYRQQCGTTEIRGSKNKQAASSCNNHKPSQQLQLGRSESITQRLISIERRLDEQAESTKRDHPTMLARPISQPCRISQSVADFAIPHQAPSAGNSWAGKVANGSLDVIKTSSTSSTRKTTIKVKGSNDSAAISNDSTAERLRFDQVLDPFEHLLTLRANISAHTIIIIIIIIKAIPRPPRKNVIAAFVGRLSLETTAESPKSFLTDAGLTDVKCGKIKGKGDIQYKTSAFFVSCSEDCRDIFYNCDTWPAGTESRG